MSDEVQTLLDKLIEGANDYIITKHILNDGGDWEPAASQASSWVLLGGFAYLVDLSRRADIEDELNVVLVRLADQIGKSS